MTVSTTVPTTSNTTPASGAGEHPARQRGVLSHPDARIGPERDQRAAHGPDTRAR
jgi:hypothetical protein